MIPMMSVGVEMPDNNESQDVACKLTGALCPRELRDWIASSSENSVRLASGLNFSSIR